jgi:hypothetical protein
MVCQVYQGSVFLGNEDCIEICAGSECYDPLIPQLINITFFQALHIHPNDKAIIYNIAMIQQKSAELLFSISVTKRTLKDLEKVVAQATHAQK